VVQRFEQHALGMRLAGTGFEKENTRLQPQSAWQAGGEI
jgi:hypothetical protein